MASQAVEQESPFPQPRENPDLWGQEAAETTFLNAARRGRLAHAWLLTGQPGIGKATLAYRCARYLLGQRRETLAPGLFGEEPVSGMLFGGQDTSNDPNPGTGLDLDPTDPLFRQVAGLAHPDLMVVEKGYDPQKKRSRSEITAEEVRRVTQFLHLTSSSGGWRVVVVDSADDMNRYAANALLKILEEPPRNTALFLVSHSPGRLLPTIRSRCRVLALDPLPETLIRRLIERWIGPQQDEAGLGGILRLSEGSIGRAAALIASGGVESYSLQLAWLGRLPALDLEALYALGDRLNAADSDSSYQTFCDLLLGLLQRLIRQGARSRPDHGGSAQDRDNSGLTAEAGEGERERERERKREGEGDASATEYAVLARLLSLASLPHWLAVHDQITQLLAQTNGLNLERKMALLQTFFLLQSVAAGGR